MTPSSGGPDRREAYWLLLLGLAFVVVFQGIGRAHLDGYALDLGNGGLPAPRYALFLALWALFGSLAAASITAGCVLWLRARGDRGRLSLLAAGSDRRWLVAAVVLGLLIPAAIRIFVLDGAPLTDDESSYRFSAQLLARGELTAESPPGKLFFDRSFMINDGRLYSQYFLGWPALMVPFLWLGLGGFANSFFSALTVPGILLSVRRLAGREASRLAILLYLSSPFLMVAAATELSHTTCFGALVWMTWAVLRSRDERAGAWPHFLVGLLFSVAFFIRPSSALGVGAPLLLWWAHGAIFRLRAGRLRAIVACAVPCLLLGGLFLAVNRAQNGAMTRIAYQAALDYARENDFRFTHWDEETTVSLPLDAGRVGVGVANAGVALFRLNGATFGWPFSLLLLPLAWRARGSGVLWAGFATFFVVHLTMVNVGIDAFGPAHYQEVVWPMIALSAIGVVRQSDRLGGAGGGSAVAATPVLLVLVLVALAVLCYVPPRFRALREMTEVINLALRAPEEQGLENAIVFAPRFITKHCDRVRPNHWVHWRPNPDPWLEDSVLWANHLTVAEDRRLMELFPQRRGYVFGWARGCRPLLVPLDDPRVEGVRPGEI